MVNSDSKSPIIEAFKREISLDIDRWGDFEMEMCDYAQSLKTEKEFVGIFAMHTDADIAPGTCGCKCPVSIRRF